MKKRKTDPARLKELRGIMEQHSLNRADLCRLLNRQESTVKCWLAGIQAVPADALRVLKLTLNAPT